MDDSHANGDGGPQQKPGLQVWRVALGFVLAPLTPSFVMVPLAILYAGDGGQGPYRTYEFLLTWITVAGIVMAPTTLIAGVPLFFVFRWRGWIDWPRFALAGALVGTVVLVFQPPVEFLVAGVISGIVAALTLWLSAYGDRGALKVAGAAVALDLLLLAGVSF